MSTDDMKRLEAARESARKAREDADRAMAEAEEAFQKKVEADLAAAKAAEEAAVKERKRLEKLAAPAAPASTPIPAPAPASASAAPAASTPATPTAPTSAAPAATAPTVDEPAAPAAKSPKSTWSYLVKGSKWVWERKGCLFSILLVIITLWIVWGVMQFMWSIFSPQTQNSQGTGEIILIVTSTPLSENYQEQPTAVPVIQPTAQVQQDQPAAPAPTAVPVKPQPAPAQPAPVPPFSWNSGEKGSTDVPAGVVCNGDQITVAGTSFGDGPKFWDGSKEQGSGRPVVVLVAKATSVTGKWASCVGGVDPTARIDEVNRLYGTHDVFSWP